MFIFLTILLLIFNDCSNSNTASLNGNHRYDHDETAIIEGVVKGQKTKLPIAGATVIFNKNSSGNSKKKINYSKKIKSDKNGYIRYSNLLKGIYDVTVEKNITMKKLFQILIFHQIIFSLSRHLKLRKKTFFIKVD